MTGAWPLLKRLSRDRSATAGVEMALATPLLLALMFGTAEVGKYIHDQHVVVQGVRDAARYAARRSFVDYPGCVPSADVQSKTQHLARNGVVTGGSGRLSYWTSDATVTVSAICDTSSSFATGGIYRGNSAGAVKVIVTATLPYTSLLKVSFGFKRGTTIYLKATEQATVAGV